MTTLATKTAAALAQLRGIDLSVWRGSGRDGQILKKDVDRIDNAVGTGKTLAYIEAGGVRLVGTDAQRAIWWRFATTSSLVWDIREGRDPLGGDDGHA